MEKKVDLKKMKPKERAGYIWEYYKIPILGGILGVIILVALIWHFATLKNTLANVMMVNATVNETGSEKQTNLFSGFMKKNGYDTNKNEILVNDSLFADPTATDSTSLYSFQSMQTIIMAGGVDVFLSDEKLYKTLNSNQEFKDLSVVLDKETLEKYKDTIIMAKDKDTGKEYPSGIVIKGNSWVKDKGLYSGDVVIGVSIASKKDKICREIIDNILGEDVK